MTANSYHPGGVNVSLGDGAVRFVSETIETKNLSTNWYSVGGNSIADKGVRPSPYGIWGALGSINGGENASLP